MESIHPSTKESSKKTECYAHANDHTVRDWQRASSLLIERPVNALALIVSYDTKHLRGSGELPRRN